MTEFVFACDGVARCTGRVAARVGKVTVLEGTGDDAGDWFARGGFGARRLATRREAEDVARYYAQDAAPEFHTGRAEPERDQRAKLDQLEKKYDLGGLSVAELAEYRRLKALVASDDETRSPPKKPPPPRPGPPPRFMARGPNGEETEVSRKDYHTLYGGEKATGKDKSATQAQHNAMAAAAGGNSTLGIPKKVGKEFLRADKGSFKAPNAKDAESGVRIVYNKLLGGWYVVRGPHQTPLNGRFSSKEEAQAWLDRRDGLNAKAKDEPINADPEEVKKAWAAARARANKKEPNYRSGMSKEDVRGMDQRVAAQRRVLLERGFAGN